MGTTLRPSRAGRVGKGGEGKGAVPGLAISGLCRNREGVSTIEWSRERPTGSGLHVTALWPALPECLKCGLERFSRS